MHSIIRRTGNKATRQVSRASVMRSASFKLGMADYRGGLPFRELPLVEQFRYERGRQFAAIWDGPIKSGRNLIDAAFDAFDNARKCRDIL